MKKIFIIVGTLMLTTPVMAAPSPEGIFHRAAHFFAQHGAKVGKYVSQAVHGVQHEGGKAVSAAAHAAKAAARAPAPPAPPVPSPTTASGAQNFAKPAGLAVVPKVAILGEFCMVGSLMFESASKGIREGRELTGREAYGAVANCIIPFFGSKIVDHIWHPEWDLLFVKHDEDRFGIGSQS